MDIAGFKVEEFLPHYLTDDQKRSLADAMNSFDDRSNLYTSQFQGEMLQGDCWDGLPFYDYSSGKLASVKGVILSNSCDIDPANKRDEPIHLTYVPLLRLEPYLQRLAEAGFSKDKIKGKASAIRGQRVTNIIYFPSSQQGLSEECFACLDRVSSIPSGGYFPIDGRRKIFTLNQFGHYLLSFKMSIHFCRLHEGVVRG